VTLANTAADNENRAEVTHRTYMLESLPGGLSDVVGSKALALSRLTRMGLPCPPAAAVTTKAYREHIARLGPLLRSRDLSLRPDRHGCRLLRESIARQPMDPALVEDLRRTYEALGCGLVAVRSSVFPDYARLPSTIVGRRTSFPGDFAAVVATIQSRWVSFWSEEQVRAREHHGVSHDTAAVAVIVQPLVLAEVSGVASVESAESGDTVVVDSSFGLCHKPSPASSGPDRYVFARHDLSFLRVQLGRKDSEFVIGFDGRVHEWTTTPARWGTPSLDPECAREIARLVVTAVDGFRQDVAVEWAIEDGRIYLLGVVPRSDRSSFAGAEEHVLPREDADGPTRFPLMASRGLQRLGGGADQDSPLLR
jgi:phosphoenolpyruvate synthase/pyruvate phosphate dikinase